jgi:hypothetical protein
MAMMMSAPAGSELLESSSWTISNPVKIKTRWYHGKMRKWIEGNAVVDPAGKMVNIIRVSISGEHSTAAMLEVSDDGRTLNFDPMEGFINMPGGTGKKFTIRFDSVSNKYWSVANWIQPRDLKLLKHKEAGALRNSVALISSTDLKEWTIERVLLYHPDPVYHAFQYPDWTFDGKDIIAVCRTAYEDGLGGAKNRHDANFMTFHRVPDFRNSLK